MKGVSPVIEHVLLIAATFSIFILSYYGYFKINEALLSKEIDNSLSLISEKTAKAVITTYEIGKRSGPAVDPVSKVNLDLPVSIAGENYRVYYSDGKIVATSKGRIKTAELLNVDQQVSISGIIKSSSETPQVKYYRESNTIILGYES